MSLLVQQGAPTPEYGAPKHCFMGSMLGRACTLLYFAGTSIPKASDPIQACEWQAELQNVRQELHKQQQVARELREKADDAVAATNSQAHAALAANRFSTGSSTFSTALGILNLSSEPSIDTLRLEVKPPVQSLQHLADFCWADVSSPNTYKR